VRKSPCVSLIRLVALAVPVILGMSCGPKRPAIAEQIAKAYGLDSFDQIEQIRYTFNAQFPGVDLSRSWIWEPKTGRVTYEGKDKAGNPVKVSYLRSQLASQDAMVKEEIDPGFTNDQYWLMFPFHTVWDSGAQVTDEGMQKLPIGDGSARKVVVKYPSDVGYTPGDTWTLFVGPDNRVQQFIFNRGGPKKPSEVITSWEGYKKAGPLLISTDHTGTADGNPARIFFTNVAVKTTGSDTWMNAQ
jgi:hypothetical protein